MNTKFYSTLILAILVSVIGCKDDDGTTTPTTSKTKTELITAGPWVLTGLTINPGVDTGGGNLLTDFYAVGDVCDNDDEAIFKADNTGSYNEGATKCDPNDDQELGTFIWSFNTEETMLTEDGETLMLSELTAEKMVLTLTINGDDIDGGEAGVDYTFTEIYGH
ncbi:MAG: hypothetical protein COA58_04840 [Bacteroidetes bacterium]|nr:MAG: hypothetical protein COA58_04840 [Bacteroidota bacterium]